MSNVIEREDNYGIYLFRLIFHTMILLFGVPGNCLIIRVYWTKTRKTSTHVLIMGLAWADLFVSLLRGINCSAYVLRLVGDPIPSVFTYIWWFEKTAIGTSIMITAVIAVDRYDCVCRPQIRFFSYVRGKLAVWASFLFSIVINIPAIITVFIGSDSLSVLELIFQIIYFVTALVMIVVCYGQVYATIRKHVKVGVLSTSHSEHCLGLENEWSTRIPHGLPKTGESNCSVINKTVSISIDQANSTCAYRTNRVQKINDASTSSQANLEVTKDKTNEKCVTRQIKMVAHSGTTTEKDQGVDGEERVNSRRRPHRDGALQRKTTKMLLVTSVVFLLTWLPYWIYITLYLISNGDKNAYSLFYKIIHELSIILLINNAVNPLIYGIANRRFRKECRDVLNKIKLC